MTIRVKTPTEATPQKKKKGSNDSGQLHHFSHLFSIYFFNKLCFRGLVSVWVEHRYVLYTPWTAPAWAAAQRSPFFLSFPSCPQVSPYAEKGRKNPILEPVYCILVTGTISLCGISCNEAFCNIIFANTSLFPRCFLLLLHLTEGC